MARRVYTQNLNNRNKACGGSEAEPLSFAFGQCPVDPFTIHVREIAKDKTILQEARDNGEGSFIFFGPYTDWAGGRINYNSGLVAELVLPRPLTPQATLEVEYRYTDPWNHSTMSESIGRETWAQELERYRILARKDGFFTRQDRERFDRLRLKERLWFDKDNRLLLFSYLEG